MESAKKSHQKKSYVVIYTIRCKLSVVSTGKHLTPEKPIYLKLISRVKPELRKFEALLDFEKSPLYQSLVSPNNKTFKVGLGSEHLHAAIKDVPQLSKLNSTQKRTVVSVARSCVTDPEVANINLIQGPPGTGKSSTIVGLLLQILYGQMRNSKRETFPRILVVAPSNAAVDEVARKLIAAKRNLGDKTKFRMVRIGVKKSMHDEVQKYSLEENVDRIVHEETNRVKATESLKKDIDNKQKAANALFEEKQEAEQDGNTDLAAKLNRDWTEMQHNIKRIKAEMAKPLGSKEIRDMKRRAEDQVMAGADIILTTLSSSLNREMDKYFVQGELKVYFN